VCPEAGRYKDPNNRVFTVKRDYVWLEATPPGVPTAALKDIQAEPGPVVCFVQLQPQFDVGLIKGHRPTQLVPREVFSALVKKRIYVPEDKRPNRSLSARQRKALTQELTAEAMQHVEPQTAGQPAVNAAAATAPCINAGHKGRKAKALVAG